jgi:hypothetical protein
MTSSPPLPWLRPPERSPVPPDPRDVRIADLLQTDPAGAHVAVIGIPFDTAVIGRRGAREAPAAIRRALYRMTAFDLESGVDLAEGLRLVDLGDVAVVHTDIHETHRRVTAVLREVTRQGLRSLVLGGDHSLSYATLRGVIEGLGEPPGLSSFLRVGYYWAEAHEEVERWSALPGRCPSRRGREADEMREVERDRSRTPLPAQRVKRTR